MENDNVVAGGEIAPQDQHTQAGFADEEWMTIEQVAEHFGCSAVRVREWITSGMLTPQPFGSIERIKRSEVELIGNPDEGAAEAFEKNHGG